MNKASYLGILWPSRGRTFIHGTISLISWANIPSNIRTRTFYGQNVSLVDGTSTSDLCDLVSTVRVLVTKEHMVAMSRYVDC